MAPVNVRDSLCLNVTDSPDSGFHRTTPVPSGSHRRSGDENYSREPRPEHISADNAQGQSYHLLDITFSASQNGHPKVSYSLVDIDYILQ